MLACYTADLLASDSDNEKNTCKAFRESKQLREEKKRAASFKFLKDKGVILRASERKGYP